MRKKISSLVFFCFFLFFSVLVFAGGQQESEDQYPSKTIRILVTKSLGGSVDSAIRLIAPFMEKELGVPVVVQNMTSAGGRAAAEEVFKSAPDGYTLLAAPIPSAIIGQLLYDSSADFHDFVPIFNIMQTFQTVTVGTNSGINSFQELLDKNAERKITMAGSGGMGSNASIVYAKLKNIGLGNLTMVPFPGAREAASAVMGNHCDISSQSTSGVLTFVENGTMKVLAVCSPERISFLPDVPTFRELGYNDFIVPLTSSLFGPPGMDENKISVLENAFKKVLEDPKFESMRTEMNVSLDPVYSEELRQMVLDSFGLVEETLPEMKAAGAGQQ